MTADSPVVLLSQSWTNQLFHTSIAAWPTYRFLRRQVRWSGIPTFLRAFHSLSWSTLSKETERNVFMKFPCFLYNPANVGNLISSSSSFSKSSLDIWKFLVHIILKPSVQDFKHDLTSMGDECNCLRVHSLVLPFLGTGMRTDLCQSCAHGWVFQTCWHNECKTLMASAFRDLVNSSAGISSHPPALLTAMLLKAHLTPECLALGD